MVEPRGKCYEDAFRFVLKEEEGELVHGTVESRGKRIGHAWVELPTGYIWEPEYKTFFTRSEFAKVKPMGEARYSVEEAAKMAARTGNFGPWTEAERRSIFGGGDVECKKEPTRRELTRFALKLVASMRGHSAGVVEVSQLKDWTKEEIEGTANLLLEDLREGRTEELERLYLETCGEPFKEEYLAG